MTYSGAALRRFDAPRPALKPVPFEDAIAFAERRGVVLPDVYYGQLQGFARAKAFSVAGLTSADQIQQVLDSLNRSLREGDHFSDWVKKVRAGEVPLAFPRHRLETIFRTNVQGAYGRGRVEQQERTKDRYPYLMYDAVNDSRTRPNHKALDGYIAPYGDPFWRTHTPPLGYNCRCTLVSLTRAQAIQRGYGKQTVPPDGVADLGWDYDKREELEKREDVGIRRAIQRRIDKAPPPVKAAIEEVTTPKAGPLGTPLMDALVIGKGSSAEPFRHILGVIEKLHGDGKLPKTHGLAGRSRQNYGHFSHGVEGRVAPEVVYSAPLAKDRLGHPELTLAHEIGHWIDFFGIAKPRLFASEAADDLMYGWRKAVQESEAFRKIQQAVVERRNVKYASYLLRAREIWARSYAQWVAVRSGDAKLLEQLDKIRRKAYSGEQRASQWEDADFEPIAREIDALFRKLGWMA
ncbi:MAG: phage head morphogenesis protein [Burkholderiales bacterium]|nr:phage head morphogenesis protein [Burkholderiales bacterium]